MVIRYNAEMPYLIDGHNLIPQVGLRLSDPDDEMELVNLLGEFCRLSRKRAEVYFDGAGPGQIPIRKQGAVTAHFVRSPVPADDAIAARLRQLGGDARNWTLVSSDQRVQAEARAAHAEVLPSALFARQIMEKLKFGKTKSAHDGESMTAAELREWLEIFNKKVK